MIIFLGVHNKFLVGIQKIEVVILFLRE